MEIANKPVHLWDTLVAHPCQKVGFAEAMQTMGYHALYLREGEAAALALVRGLLFGFTWMTARANLFAPGADASFMLKALSSLAAMGIPHVKVGDTMFGLQSSTADASWGFPKVDVFRRHTFTLDLSESEESLAKKQESSVRSSWRKADREGLNVHEIADNAALESYIQLATETSARVREVTAYTDFPGAFFRKLYYGLSPSGAAKFYLASIDKTPLAGGIFLCSKDRMLYFAGASQRDRKWTPLQAPTAILWHAIRDAKRLGIRCFDFGGCTPTEDKDDPRYSVYSFKRRWGGELEMFYNLNITLSPVSSLIQERILSPLWNKVHPVYFKLCGFSQLIKQSYSKTAKPGE